MDRFPQQAQRALVRCLDRTRGAVYCLQRGDLEQALAILRWRKAAYHDFRTAEAMCDDQNLTEAQVQWQQLAQELLLASNDLVKAIENTQATLQKDLENVGRTRRILCQYLIGGDHDATVELTV